jgi:heptosyltransferase-2
MAEQKILILELGGIGDTAMSIPAVRAVLNGHKNADITVLTVPRTRAVIDSLRKEGFENLDVVSTDVMDENGNDSWPGLIKGMRGKRFDIAIDLSAVETFKAAIKRWVFFKSLGVKNTFGRNTDGRGWGFSKKSEDVLTSSDHEVLRKIKVVELLGLKADRTAPALIIPDNEIKEADTMLSGWQNDNGPIIGINPGAFRPSRTWPAERFKQIAEWLIEEMSANIVITGGDKERAVAERIAGSLPEDRVRTVTGVSIMTLAAVMKKMYIFITNDTGPMHIAAAAGVPVVSMFGQTNLHRYHPYMDKSKYTAIKKDHSLCPFYSFKYPMQECRRHDCEDKKCMDSITLDEVREAVIKLMKTLNREALVQC